MPRTIRDAALQTREARGRLKARGKPYYRGIEQGLHVGYRKSGKIAGRWLLRRYTGNQGYEFMPLGTADDFADADGIAVLTFKQAQERAQQLARGNARSDGEDRRTVTVAVALDLYEADLRARGAEAANASRVRLHLSPILLERPVALLTSKSLTAWRNGLLAGMTRAGADRVCRAFKAALNLVADQSEGAQSRSAWEIGLKPFGGAAERQRNVVVPDADVLRIVAAAAQQNKEFALYVEALATTGARPSQVARVRVRDLGRDFLEMPSSRKGWTQKKISHRRVPIALALAKRLRQAAAAVGKGDDAFLFTRPDGVAWKRTDHSRPFALTVARAGLDPAIVTIYALRHSSITRQLVAGVPIRVVAALHDTSVLMIEKTYSIEIDKHVDAIVRPALLNTEAPLPSNVAPIFRGR